MKVDLSDKQCAKKHKKFFISLHFPLLLYFSLFWKQEKREREREREAIRASSGSLKYVLQLWTWVLRKCFQIVCVVVVVYV